MQILNLLTGLNNKGISENEITGAAVVMKQKSLKIDVNCKENIDTCGTGGTGIHTFNCSTASAFVAAAGGARLRNTEIKLFLVNLVVLIFNSGRS